MKEIEEIRSYCLNCKNSQCRIKGCPLGNCIPEFIHEIDSKKAYEILCNTTVLPAICGRICPHEKQCEGSCIRGIKGEPVSIGAMEAYIGDLSIENNYELSIEVDERTKDKRVAVIGSGPAGLTCAAFLARRGVKVVVYEKHDKLGGLLTHGIPEFRLPREVVEKTIEKILDLGVEVKLNQELGRDFEIEDLAKKYDAVFVFINMNGFAQENTVRLSYSMSHSLEIPWYVKEVPTVFVSLNLTNHLIDVPMARTYINAYSANRCYVRKTLEKMAGKEKFLGQCDDNVFCDRMDTRW